MDYTILSSTPCAVKINGEFSGIAGQNYTYFSGEKDLLEFIPLDDTYLPVAVYLENGKTVSTSVKTYSVKDTTLIMPVYKRNIVSDFKTIGNVSIPFKNSTLSVSCYAENGIKIKVKYKDEFLVENVPFMISDAEFLPDKTYGNYLIAVLTGERTLILGFSITDKIRLIFKNVCDGYETNGNTLTIIENKPDILLHTLTSKWSFSSDVKKEDVKIYRGKDIYSLSDKQIPFAFFEELFLGASFSDFLTPKLKLRADELKEFIGNFSACLPPVKYIDQNCVLLLSGDKIKIAKCDILGTLIDNVYLDD